MKNILKLAAAVVAVLASVQMPLNAQKYGNGLIDKTIAVVGNEMISLSELEQEILYMRMQGMYSDRNMRCEQLERMLESKLFLMQARCGFSHGEPGDGVKHSGAAYRPDAYSARG